VLDQVAPKGDIQHLAPSAYTQDRHRRLDCLTNERHLPFVAVGVYAASFSRSGLAITPRIDVAATREEQTVKTGQQRTVAAKGRGHQQVGRSPRSPNAITVCSVDHIEATCACIHLTGGDADHWARRSAHLSADRP
jgi:hypothetical protein